MLASAKNNGFFGITSFAHIIFNVKIDLLSFVVCDTTVYTVEIHQSSDFYLLLKISLASTSS